MKYSNIQKLIFLAVLLMSLSTGAEAKSKRVPSPAKEEIAVQVSACKSLGGVATTSVPGIESFSISEGGMMGIPHAFVEAGWVFEGGTLVNVLDGGSKLELSFTCVD